MTRMIALLGLGQMGSAIALRLLDQQFQVTVHNRTSGKSALLEAAGAKVAASPQAAVQDADLVITSLRGVEAEMESLQAFAPAMKPGALHVSMSTLPPANALESARLHQAQGTRYLACPVQGRPDAARTASLTFWCCGPQEAFEQARPVLAALSSHYPWLGETTDLGPAAKLAVNMLLFGQLELLAEAHAYLARCGTSPALVLETLTQTMLSAPILRFMVADLGSDHTAKGTNLEGSLKDLRMLAQHAQSVGARLPAADAVRQQYEKALAQGHAARAQSAVLLTLGEG